MGLLLLLVVLAIVFGAFLVIAVGFTIGLLLTFIVAGFVGWAADAIVPGKLPGGWVGAVLVGLVGGFVGHLLFRGLGIHDPGFSLFGVDLIPAFVGAVLVTVAAELFTTRRASPNSLRS